MKNTALTQTHINLGARMVEFADYNMPVDYSGIKDEHKTVRQHVGVFDVSHMGEFIFKGPKALDLVQKLCSNDAAILSPGKVQYSCMPNKTGGIIDDLLVYHLEAQVYMLVVNASNLDKDWAWVQDNDEWDVEKHNISDKTTLLAVQGPKAADTLSTLTDMELNSMAYYTFEKGVFAGVENVLVSATGYTGSGGFEIFFENEHAEHIWNKIIKAGEPYLIKPIGLGARDTLRLEMGYCLYGNDIDEETSPLEAGLEWITKLKAKDFNSRDILLKQKEEGLRKKLVGFEMLDRGIARQGYAIQDEAGNQIGEVTSGTQSPTLDKAIGMGYVTKEFDTEGQEIYVAIRNKVVKAQVIKLPFYKNGA